MKRALPILSALATIIMWSSLASLTLALNHVPALFTVGAVLLIAALPGLRYWRTWRMPLSVWVSAIVGMFGYHFLLFDAFSRAPAVEVNMIQYLWPLFIVLGSPLFGGERLNPGHVIGGMMAFIGVVIVMTGNGVDYNDDYWFGYSEAFCAALLWAFYTLSNRRYTAMPSSAVAGICGVSGIASLMVFSLSSQVLPELTLSDAIYVLMLGLGPMGLSFYTWDYAMRHGDPRFVGALAYLTPLLSMVLLAVVHSSVDLTSLHLVSLVLIILGSGLGKIWARKAIGRWEVGS